MDCFPAKRRVGRGHPSLEGPGSPKVLPMESVMVIFCLLARHTDWCYLSWILMGTFLVPALKKYAKPIFELKVHLALKQHILPACAIFRKKTGPWEPV